MTQEILKLASELSKNIRYAEQDITNVSGINHHAHGFISIGNYNVSTDSKLLKLVVDVIVDYKKKQIEEWEKKFKSL